MSYLKRNIKGQCTFELVVLIICVALALAAMRLYAQRAISGNFRDRADELGRSYQPGGATRSDLTTKLTKEETTIVTVDKRGDEYVTRTDGTIPERSPEKIERWGEETVPELPTNLF